ncbi:MAG: sigma-70 family RNA polymerase sigma factor [Acidobacteria bacterium]|nr:sigma-70 family RNA polymerase sigma factor [Acidobacteriota bacterium]
MPEITELLDAWNRGETAALDELIPIVYEELHRIAAARMAEDEQGAITLRPTALVHEAYLRLHEHRHPNFTDRSHFFGAASRLMRRILVDHARRRNAARRGSGAIRVEIDEDNSASPFTFDWVDLNTALDKLETVDPELARLVEFRYFGGLTIHETAEAMHISEAEVKRQWPAAKAFLFREVSGSWKSNGGQP